MSLNYSMSDSCYKVVFVRHGESQFNQENRFAGWIDTGNDLSDHGWQQAIAAAEILREQGFSFDLAYTSLLKRAINTLWKIQDVMDLAWIPVIKSWRLNERHYGALQGLNKIETVEKYGEEQVMAWRRSFSTPPPSVDKDNPNHPSHDRRYASLTEAELPVGESLEATMKRTLPFWKHEIVTQIQSGQQVLIVAHGNSLRSLIMDIDHLSEADIVNLNIPTGIPLVYEFDEELKPIRHYYLGDQAAIQAGIEAVANQTKKS